MKMKTADLLRMLATSEEDIERLMEQSERLSREAERLRETDRCPEANVKGSDFCEAHRYSSAATVSSLDPPKPGGRRCRQRVPLSPPRPAPCTSDAMGELPAGQWRR